MSPPNEGERGSHKEIEGGEGMGIPKGEGRGNPQGERGRNPLKGIEDAPKKKEKATDGGTPKGKKEIGIS